MLGKITTPKYCPKINAAFRDALNVAGSPPRKLSNGTYNWKVVEPITRLMHQYLDSVEKGTWKEDGWPASPYAVSKTGLIGLSLILGRQLGLDGSKDTEVHEQGRVLINACCPGYVRTDMTKGKGRRTPERAAALPLKLALQTIEASGEFWEGESISNWSPEELSPGTPTMNEE